MKATLLLAALIAAPAFAQTPPASIGQPFIPAPWWMKDPVIAAMGHVRAEVPANRARFAARFSVVEKTAAAATTARAQRWWRVSRKRNTRAGTAMPTTSA